MSFVSTFYLDVENEEKMLKKDLFVTICNRESLKVKDLRGKTCYEVKQYLMVVS